MSEDQNHIEELIAKSLVGETSPAEEKLLADWLAAHDDNQKLFDQSKRAFEEGSNFYATSSEINSINVEKEWSQFSNTVSKKDNTRTLVVEKDKGFSWIRIAATLLLIAVSGFIVNYFITRKTDVVFTASENMLPVTLPDGTQITLNKNSQLSYSKSFGEQRREVTLKGEAFFEVAHDAAKPFVITAGQAQVEVLGTSFNVMAYDDEKEISVTVETGKVKLSESKTNQEVRLEAGQKGSFNKESNQLNSSANTNINFLSWKTHKLNFSEQHLRSVIDDINKAYDAHIEIAATLSDNCVVTVNFDGQSLEAVLNVLKSTLNLTYEEKNGKIVITSAGC